ncbi:MAG: hypothetical protein VB027_07385 [Gordonibacter sp.]|nr:hypothetical protein [Gordonibacter sp.]
MMDEDSRATANSLMRINKVCMGIKIVLKVVFVIICISWVLVAGVMILSSAGVLSSGESEDMGIVPILLHIVRGCVVAVLFVILIGVFSEAAKGESPFTLKQVKRLIMMSLALLTYALLEIIFSASSVMLQLGNLNSGYISTGSSAIITVDFSPFIAAAVVFAFSFVFEYGVLLQEFSDDTV